MSVDRRAWLESLFGSRQAIGFDGARSALRHWLRLSRLTVGLLDG